MDSNLFAMREKQIHAMQKNINPGTTPLFLFDFSRRKMHGIFVATSQPGLNLVPDAFSQGLGEHWEPSVFCAQVSVILCYYDRHASRTDKQADMQQHPVHR